MMKTTKALVLICIICSGPISLAQEDAADLQFYKRLAQRDAAYEQTIQFSNEQDERDYWRDQKNFEELLLQKNPEGYLVYISNKRPRYVGHIQKCHKECGHGDFYKREVASFLLKTSNGPIYGWSLSNTLKRKGANQYK